MSARISTAIPSRRDLSVTDTITDHKRVVSPTTEALFSGHHLSQVSGTPKALEPNEVVAGHMDSVKNIITSVEKLPMEDSDKESLRQSLHQSFKELSMLRRVQDNTKNPRMVLTMAD